MKPRVELSGLGHYGVCTIISNPDFKKAIELLKKYQEKLQKLGKEEDWQLDINSYSRFGLDRCMNFLENDLEAPEIKIGWNPKKIYQAIETHCHLARKASFGSSFEETRNLSGDFLEVMASHCENGWFVAANFGTDIWDVIENPAFRKLLPQINSNIQKWWQDMYGSKMDGQYSTVFNGRCGLVLQVYQPLGNGLWIAGDRQFDGCSDYQFTSHNTDTSQQAFSHILSLCIILKYCREFIAQN